MMIQNAIVFDENKYEIREQLGSSIVVAKKKIILPEMEKKDITVVNNTSGIFVTDPMEMIDGLLLEQRQFVKTR